MDTGNVYGEIERVLRRIDEIKRDFKEKETYYNKKFEQLYRSRIKEFTSGANGVNRTKEDNMNGRRPGKDKGTGSEVMNTGMRSAERNKSKVNTGFKRDIKGSVNIKKNNTRTDSSFKKEDLKESVINEAAKKFGLPESLIRAIIKQESNFNERAISSKGAMGLMQLMPETADILGVNNPFDIKENIFGGTRYLRDLLELYGGNLNMALAAYNAGPSRVKNEIPDIKETKSFVDSVIKFYKKYSKYEDIR